MNMPTLKKRLAARELTIGSWLSFASTTVCEMMAKAGFDWLVIDMEHAPIDLWQAQQLIQIIDLSGCVPLVRVGSHDPLLMKRAMDAGAHGIIVPMVNTSEEAVRAVSALRYPPNGSRGVGLSRAQEYGMGFQRYKEWADTESVMIVQIEHIHAVENLEGILSVEGVDAFIVGPYDLSGSLGHPGEFTHPEVVAALENVRRVMQEGSLSGGYHVVHSDHQTLKNKISEGYTFIAYGDDMIFLAEKLRDETDFVRKVRSVK